MSVEERKLTPSEKKIKAIRKETPKRFYRSLWKKEGRKNLLRHFNQNG